MNRWNKKEFGNTQINSYRIVKPRKKNPNNILVYFYCVFIYNEVYEMNVRRSCPEYK
jgi:hypothetical protein